MPDFTFQQKQFLTKSLASAGRCRDMATEALNLNLPLLATEWLACAKSIENGIGFEERAFREGTLAEPTQLDFNHPEEG